MYPSSSPLPAPYELNSQPQMGQMGYNSNSNSNQMGYNSNPSASAPYFSHGGRVKHRKMVIAHFNPQELNVLDHLQGHQERCPKTGLRSYSHLEELFKNPHIVENVHKHAQAEHHAQGGSAGLEHLAEEGRKGDTEIALIGPHTHNLFDRMAGHRTQNPHTGHPEYWSLGNALKGAYNTIKGGAQNAYNTIRGGVQKALPSVLNTAKGVGSALAPLAGTALGSAFGPAGTALGGMAGNALGNAISGGAPLSPGATALQQGAQSAYDSYRGGQSPTSSLGQGLQTIGGRFGQGGMGGALQGAGHALSQGQGWRGALSSGAGKGFEGIGGQQGLINSAKNIMGGYGTEGGMRGAASHEAQDYMNKFIPQYS